MRFEQNQEDELKLVPEYDGALDLTLKHENFSITYHYQIYKSANCEDVLLMSFSTRKKTEDGQNGTTDEQETPMLPEFLKRYVYGANNKLAKSLFERLFLDFFTIEKFTLAGHKETTTENKFFLFIQEKYISSLAKEIEENKAGNEFLNAVFQKLDSHYPSSDNSLSISFANSLEPGAESEAGSNNPFNRNRFPSPPQSQISNQTSNQERRVVSPNKGCCC